LAKREERVKSMPSRLTKEDFKQLVDYYDADSPGDTLLKAIPAQTSLPPGDESHSATEDDVEDEARIHTWPAADDNVKWCLEHLEHVLEDEMSAHEIVFEQYRALPAPRITYLYPKTRHRLLHHLSVVEHRNEASMLRFLSVVDDMKAVGIPLNRSEWASAIAFAGRYVGRITDTEVESALYLWQEMEHEAKVKSDSATFNILFDIATKAGKFALAELIMKEMHGRKLSFSRFNYVTTMFYYGLKGDGNSVRNTYRQLVDAGEIVDTVVLNCVMSSLLRVGEPNAAEHIYERMKSMHAASSGRKLPPPNWRKKRDLRRALVHAARRAKNKPELLQQIQNHTPIAPNLQTYKILISHHAIHTGELDIVVKLIKDMAHFHVAMHGAIFLSLFRGFALRGGMRYTSWTVERLESVYAALHSALDDTTTEIYLGKWMVLRVLEAHAKCSGKERLLEVWEELKSKWDSTQDELEFINGCLRNLLASNSPLECTSRCN
jgi:pentatricopeptide repeat protein